MPAIKAWLADATAQLKAAGIESARLDAELILAHTLRRSRTYLHAHDDDPIDASRLEIADARLRLRLDRTPIAYIIGHKEFYGRQFKVTTATLIPRPESEDIINLLKEDVSLADLPLLPSAPHRVVDVGTGSGCLGITIKLEFPHFDVTLIDISSHALTVAEKNAQTLGADVTIQRGDLLRGYPFPLDIIVANLPYVDRSWDVSMETHAEPDIALYASHGGLALINQLILQAATLLTPGGLLLLEADPRQHDAMIETAKSHGLSYRTTRGFIVEFVRDR